MRTMLLAIFFLLGLLFTNAKAEDSPITVHIALPAHNGERRIENIEHTNQSNSAHFDVIVANTSDKSQRIWREWCSWGYYGLTFEFTDADGKKWVASKSGQEWTRNIPDWWTLDPHENMVIEVYFADLKIWQHFPMPTNGSQTITMQAVFEFKPDQESVQYGVWTGRVVSEAEKITFYHWKADATTIPVTPH